MRLDRFSRRAFLQGLGGAALALPFMESVLPRSARGAEPSEPIKRFVLLKVWNAPPVRRMWPTSPGLAGNYTVRPYGGGALEDGTTALQDVIEQPVALSPDTWLGHRAPLSDFITTNPNDPGLSTILSPALNPFRDKLLLLRGLTYPVSCNHNNGGWGGNFGAAEEPDQAIFTPTMDQVLAYSSKMYPGGIAAQRSLSLAPGDFASISFSNQGNASATPQGVPPITSPQAAWNAVFGGYEPPAPGGGGVPADHPRRYLVNRVIEDYRTLRDGGRISSADRQTLERHVSLLHDLEAKLQGLPMAPTATCTVPSDPGVLTTDNPEVLKATYDAYLDLMAAAIMCDRTRVLALNCFKTVSPQGGADVVLGHGCATCNTNFGIDSDASSWHGLAHFYFGEINGDSPTMAPMEQRLTDGYTWITTHVYAELLKRLDVVESGGSTYLDNMVVMLTSELGANHFPDSVPTVLAGGLGGYLQTGWYNDYRRYSGGAPFSQENGFIGDAAWHNQLLIALLQGYGLTPQEYETESGTGRFGESRKLARDALHWDGMDLNQITEPLPGIVA